MVEEGPYEIMPYAEIDDLRNEINKVKKDNSSSKEVLDAVKKLTTLMENMLLLFQGAAKNMQEKKGSNIEKKMDDVLDQQETLAQSLVSLVDLVKDIKAEIKQVKQPAMSAPAQKVSSPGFNPKPKFNPPQQPFERPMSPPQHPGTPPPFQPQQRPPDLRNQQNSMLPDRPPMPPPPPPKLNTNHAPHNHQFNKGPSLMPTGNFKDLDANLGEAIKPNSDNKDKKGLFGINLKK